MKKANKNFHWNADGEDLPLIEPHSKAKHQVLDDYIKNWIATLCGNNRGYRKTVTLIDGFCGGGMYRDPDDNNGLWAGSPIRMIQAVQRGLDIVRQEKLKFGYELNVKYIFVEKKKKYLDCLKLQMANFRLEDYVNDPERGEFIYGEFEDVAGRILNEVKARGGSSFFFLDPLGYTDVSMKSLREIVSLGKSEILYTFMIDFIRRFLSERNGSLERAFIDILEAQGYYDLITFSALDTQSHQQYLRNETMRLFRERACARYVYSFALLPNASLVKYYLIHLASSPTAQKVMKTSLWDVNNIDINYQFRYGVYGLGFRTPDFYDENCRVFDFQETNIEAVINDLDKDLMPIIYSAEENGIPIGNLHEGTTQKNPATWNHYVDYLNEQRSNQEIQIFRDGKVTRAKNLKPGDIIMKARQVKLFDVRGFSSS
jgi:three-Cys-motif partner protein